MIGARVKIVVVSLGADGAAACVDGRAVAVEGYDVGPSIDTTGAGDLFVAAWAWGDAAGLAVDDALRWAALYAALSVRVPTGAGGATRLEEFVEEGTRRGLPAPPRAASGSPEGTRRGAARRRGGEARWRRDGARRGAAARSRGAPARRRRRRRSPPRARRRAILRLRPTRGPARARARPRRRSRGRRSASRCARGSSGTSIRRRAASSPGSCSRAPGCCGRTTTPATTPQVFALSRTGRLLRRGRRSRARRTSTGRTSRSAGARSTSATSATTWRSAPTSRSTASPSPRPARRSVAGRADRAALPRRRRTTPRRCSSTRAAARS